MHVARPPGLSVRTDCWIAPFSCDGQRARETTTRRVAVEHTIHPSSRELLDLVDKVGIAVADSLIGAQLLEERPVVL